MRNNSKKKKEPQIDADNESNYEKKHSKRKRVKKNHFFLKLFIKIFLIFLIIVSCYLSFKAYVFQKLAKEMFNNSPSVIYNQNGDVVAKFGTERARQNIKYGDIPPNLINAYISIEDERYYSHFGIDIKRTGGAILSFFINRGSPSYGGSTITQQLVKNLTGNDSASLSRKVKEWFYAIVLNTCFSKEEIIEAYLNIIYTGPSIYGVQEASKYYFDEDVQNISLAKMAYLAGINHGPNYYNPFTDTDRTEKINKRTKIVLNKMLELKYISEEEYNDAILEVNNGLAFKKGKIERESYTFSYYTDALLNDIISNLSKKFFITQDFATNYFVTSGSNIYGLENSEIQNILEKEFENSSYIIKSKNGKDTSQAAMIILDNKTGSVVACVGGLGKKVYSRTFNRSTQMKRQTGSSIKPLAIVVPAIDKKIATPISIIDDSETTFVDNNGETYTPIDYDPCRGKITLREALETSQNIPFVKLIEQLTPEVSINYLKQMGITSLNEKDNNLALALGGIDVGISPIELAGAYHTIANNGVYIKPNFYTKIDTMNGKKFITFNQLKRRVFSTDVACIIRQLLTEPVNSPNGTATNCKISGIDVAAKTGTTNEEYDKWLCGFTPYYTATCWFGFDENEKIVFGSQNPASLIWSSVMKKIHQNLPNSKFEISKNVITKEICKDSKKQAGPNCKNTYTEYFLPSTEIEICNEH